MSARPPRGLVVAAAGLLFAASLLVRVLPLPRANAGARRLARRLAPWLLPRSGVTPLSVAEAVERANGMLPWFECLPRALACDALLRAGGHESEVVLGVAREAGSAGLLAHAWAELDGVPYAGPLLGEHVYARLVPPRTA